MGRKVPRAGLEPARPNGHMALNHACLPIPAPGPLFFFGGRKSDLAGARTQDPLLKREMLYQLSYQILLLEFLLMRVQIYYHLFTFQEQNDINLGIT